MAGVYRPRHPERSVLHRVLSHHFEGFLAEYESRFEREYGYFRPVVKEVVEKYLDCGNPRCGFARPCQHGFACMKAPGISSDFSISSPFQ